MCIQPLRLMLQGEEGPWGDLVGARMAYSFILVISVEPAEGEALYKGHGANTVLALSSLPASGETVKQGRLPCGSPGALLGTQRRQPA